MPHEFARQCLVHIGQEGALRMHACSMLQWSPCQQPSSVHTACIYRVCHADKIWIRSIIRKTAKAPARCTVRMRCQHFALMQVILSGSCIASILVHQVATNEPQRHAHTEDPSRAGTCRLDAVASLLRSQAVLDLAAAHSASVASSGPAAAADHTFLDPAQPARFAEAFRAAVLLGHLPSLQLINTTMLPDPALVRCCCASMHDPVTPPCMLRHECQRHESHRHVIDFCYHLSHTDVCQRPALPLGRLLTK